MRKIELNEIFRTGVSFYIQIQNATEATETKFYYHSYFFFLSSILFLLLSGENIMSSQIELLIITSFPPLELKEEGLSALLNPDRLFH